MGSSDCIDIQLFHQMNVLCHVFKAYRRSGITVEIMAVNPLQLYGNVVNLEYFTVDLNFTETNLFFDQLTVCDQMKGIQLGIIRCPGTDIFHADANTVSGFHNCFRICNLTADINCTFVDDRQKTVFTFNCGFQLVIRDMIFGTGKQVYISENTGETELVLAFQIGGDTPFQNEYIEGVFAVLRKIGDIKLAGCMGNLGVTLEFAVDVQIECGVNAFKIEVIPFACLFSQIECPAVVPAGIFIGKVRKHNREGIPGIQILDVVITVHLYTGRNRDRFIQLFVDIKIIHMSMLLDLPYAVERHKTGAGGTVLNAVLDPDGVRFRKGNIVTAMRFSTDAFKAFKFSHISFPHTLP